MLSNPRPWSGTGRWRGERVVPVNGRAMPQPPLQRSSRRSRVPVGSSPAGTRSVLTISTRARAPNPTQSAEGVLEGGGTSAAAGGVVGLEESELGEPNRLGDLVVPEDVRARPGACLLDDGPHVPDGLGLLDVVLGLHVETRSRPRTPGSAPPRRSGRGTLSRRGPAPSRSRTEGSAGQEEGERPAGALEAVMASHAVEDSRLARLGHSGSGQYPRMLAGSEGARGHPSPAG